MRNESPSGQARGSDVFFAREAITGVPWMVVTKLVLFFVYFAISVMTVRWLGPDEYGLFTICINIAGLIGVFCCLGLIPGYFRFVPELVVNKNKAGLKRLIFKSSAMQAVALGVALLVMISGRSFFEGWFGVEFRHGLILSAVLASVMLLKDSVAAVETSLFRARRVSLLSFMQSVLWLVALGVGLWFFPTSGMALTAQALSYGVVYAMGAVLLFRHIHSLNWRSPLQGIGRQRALKFSGVIYLNSIIRLLMLQYTEVIFLGRMRPPAEVGAYSLGYSLPPQVIFFVPMALQMLFTAGFSDAYSRDPNCLNRLIAAFYKMQILFTVPLAVFGVFFAPVAVPLVYGPGMAQAGRIASAFCLIHLFPMISTPLSMAIQAKEKVHRMLPLMILQISVNLILDVWLILYLDLGVWGGVLAVALTFLITIPFRLRVVRSIIGGIYFPTGYLLRIALPLALWAALIWALFGAGVRVARLDQGGLLLLLLFAAGGVYLLGALVLIRRFRLVRPADVADFHALGIERLNRILDVLVRPGPPTDA